MSHPRPTQASCIVEIKMQHENGREFKVADYKGSESSTIIVTCSLNASICWIIDHFVETPSLKRLHYGRVQRVLDKDDNNIWRNYWNESVYKISEKIGPEFIGTDFYLQLTMKVYWDWDQTPPSSDSDSASSEAAASATPALRHVVLFKWKDG